MGISKEQRFVKRTIKDMENYFNGENKLNKNFTIDENIQKKFNMEKLRNELNELNYDIMFYKDSDEYKNLTTYPKLQLKNRLYIYKK